MVDEKYLTEREQRLAEGLAALHTETEEGVLPSRIQDLLLASEVAVSSLAASRALVEELRGKVMQIDTSYGSLNAELKRDALALKEKP